MNPEKFQFFIKELRLEKKLSQEQLANMIFVSRTTITKWENGKSVPDSDKYELLCQFFNISIEELILSERKTSKNINSLSNAILNFIREQSKKNKRLKLMLVICFLIIILMFIGVTILYYISNYNSIHFYTYSGKSENVEISDGLLIISKDKIYFTLGNIVPEYDGIINIYSVNGNEEQIIYSGQSFNLIKEYYGYDSFIDYLEFLKGNQIVYIELNSEKIELVFSESFSNDKYFYDKVENIGTEYDFSEQFIPDKILKKFNCTNNICTFNINNNVLTYNYPIFNVVTPSENITYFINTKLFDYKKYHNNSIYQSFKIIDGKVSCESYNCEDASQIYKKFEDEYIKIYLCN